MHSVLMNMATDACLRLLSGLKVCISKVEARDITKTFHRQRRM